MEIDINAQTVTFTGRSEINTIQKALCHMVVYFGPDAGEEYKTMHDKLLETIYKTGGHTRGQERGQS